MFEHNFMCRVKSGLTFELEYICRFSTIFKFWSFHAGLLVPTRAWCSFKAEWIVLTQHTESRAELDAVVSRNGCESSAIRHVWFVNNVPHTWQWHEEFPRHNSQLMSALKSKQGLSTDLLLSLSHRLEPAAVVWMSNRKPRFVRLVSGKAHEFGPQIHAFVNCYKSREWLKRHEIVCEDPDYISFHCWW